MKKKTEIRKGWIILNQRNAVEISMMIGKIKMTIERGDYLGRQKIRISRKVVDEAFNLLNNKSQRKKK